MKSRAIIPLTIGLLIGVFAIKYFVNVVKKAKGATTTETVQVVYANTDIAPTVEIKETMLEVKNLPRAVAPKLYFQDVKEVTGRVAGLAIPAGLPVVPSLLAPKGTPPGLSVRIKDGFRAVAVQVDESAGVAGWVKPGSRVDVVAVMSARGSSGTETISKVILQNIEVLAVGQDGGTKGDTGAALAKSVTLAVTPDEMPKLHLAATKGKIRLAMRSQADDSQQQVAQTTDNDLLGLPGQNKPAPSKFLAGMLSNLPKPDPRAADKEFRAHKASAPAQPVPAVASAIHRVEVFEGPRVYNVLFEGEGPNLRRLSPGKEPRAASTPSGLQAVADSPIRPESGR
ncbi:MAG TPA: Flp pilus assembly protein CpaB [Phycisphaerae bacterium]|jgi:pilus assembly protein CpaB|nr:Flp pilus assembly protein CpaB [Phycisphaerae bacterium]HOL26895.1 Flp pilus assembly protein CpaB [Phycisphaerae bacterium]HPP20850.1 Flp pilus assembly protein CpaB [Phycisphaerae bacterium]HPU33083.1 Flp pilus assembly protein CpaB [Phycisphaerae bacterium]HQA43751.1 Flp pilus assembly protein CpaB [Phycisphaerae bacterium]